MFKINIQYSDHNSKITCNISSSWLVKLKLKVSRTYLDDVENSLIILNFQLEAGNLQLEYGNFKLESKRSSTWI